MSWIDDHDITEIFDEPNKEKECSHEWELDSSTRNGDVYICNKCKQIRRE